MPHVGSVAELNDLLAAADAKDDHRRLEGRTVTVGTDFALEAGVLRPLPAEAFESGTTLTPRVDRHSRISIRQVCYSVPARFIGARLRTLLRAEEVLVFDGRTVVARHERSRVRGGQVLVLDHYLEVLARKPGALPGSMALSQARATGVFTVAHEAFWTRARRLHGDSDGTRALIEVLLLHRHLPADAVIAGIRAARRRSRRCTRRCSTSWATSTWSTVPVRRRFCTGGRGGRAADPIRGSGHPAQRGRGGVRRAQSGDREASAVLRRTNPWGPVGVLRLRAANPSGVRAGQRQLPGQSGP
jgi:hypothetical protein